MSDQFCITENVRASLKLLECKYLCWMPKEALEREILGRNVAWDLWRGVRVCLADELEVLLGFYHFVRNVLLKAGGCLLPLTVLLCLSLSQDFRMKLNEHRTFTSCRSRWAFKPWAQLK